MWPRVYLATAIRFSGTLTIDTIDGTVLTGDLFVGSVGEFNDMVFGGSAVNFSSTDTPDYVWAGVNFRSLDAGLSNATLQLDIYLGATNSLVGYSGGPLCVNEGDFSGNCGNYLSSYQLTADPDLISGSLSAAGAPEPSSFLLMAGPVIWFGGRRRFRFGR